MLVFLWLGQSEAAVNIASLSTEFSTGRERMARIVNELVAAGYLKRRQIRSGGAFPGLDYCLAGDLRPRSERGVRHG